MAVVAGQMSQQGGLTHQPGSGDQRYREMVGDVGDNFSIILVR
jgi:hypothetical protein